MSFEFMVGEPHEEPALQHGVDDGGLRVDVPAIPQIDLVDDFSHQAQARLLDPESGDHGFKRTQVALMTEGTLAHVKGNFSGLRRIRAADDSRWVDEPPDEPDVGKPINIRTCPGDPAPVAVCLNGSGSDHGRRRLAGCQRLGDARQVCCDEAPLWSVEEVDTGDLSVLSSQPLKPLSQPRALLWFEPRTQALLQDGRLRLYRRIILGPGPAEAFDEVGVGQPLKLLHTHHYSLPLGLLHLLG
jgi:hypothetical protein